jgi:hypothetical protein
MSEEGLFSIDCGTCIATGTTACNECLVTEVLAAADVPIDLTPAPVDGCGRSERAVRLFRAAGLIGDEPVWVEPEEFEAALPWPGARPPTTLDRRHPGAPRG